MVNCAAPGGAAQLTIQNAATFTASGLGWAYGNAGGLGQAGAVLPGGPQAVSAFVTSKAGYAANPRWINAEAFMGFGTGGAAQFGGVDLSGDGLVDARDKALRDWAVWRLKCDAYLPEAMDNNDAFEAQLHANNRLRWGNRLGTKDGGFEFLSPLIVGDSFYQIFRSDPIHTMCDGISGEGGKLGDPMATKSDIGGYRYPYDRTHIGKDTGVALVDDPVGGLININQVNNNYNTEEWISSPADGATPQSLTWYHINEAKWIYCYDPLDANRRFGRYAVTVMPDCGTWNAAALHSGDPNPAHTTLWMTAGAGTVVTAGGMIEAIRVGFNPKTGDRAGAALLPGALICYAPIRPSPLPVNWLNPMTDPRDIDGDGNNEPLTYMSADGQPDSANMSPGHHDYISGWSDYGRQFVYPQVDYTRAAEIRTGHWGTSAWDISGHGSVRAAIFNYLIWLGPYNSRSEFATHLRKAGIAIPRNSAGQTWPDYPVQMGINADERACMETDINNNEADLTKVAAAAQLIAALTTVHGYYYTLDRFWDRNLLMVDWEKAVEGDATDYRFCTPQSSSTAPVTFAQAGTLPSQKTRNRFLRDLQKVECFGGYRTRDGNYKLLDYLFSGDTAPAEYLTFLNDDLSQDWAANSTSYYKRSAVYGGPGTLDDPTSWENQGNPKSKADTAYHKTVSRREKFMAMTASRIASTNRWAGGENGVPATAACPNGHLLLAPKLSAWDKPVWNGTAKSTTTRASAADPTDDEIGAGCPVCGGKLFVNQPYDQTVNEIGRYHGKFRNAENPARFAWNMKDGGDEAKKPARHFVELLTAGRGCGYAGDSWVRFDTYSMKEDGKEAMLAPAILADPITAKPYYSHDFEFDWRFGKRTDDAGGRDPEPFFRCMWQRGNACFEFNYVRLFVYDELDQGGKGRWHSPTWYVDNNYYAGWDAGWAVGGGVGGPDPQVYNRVRYTDDLDPDSTKWKTAAVTCDEYYCMEDPDPAHRQGSSLGNVTFPPTAHSGTKVHVSAIAAGEHQHYYYDAPVQAIAAGATLYAWIYLDPANPPAEVMIQWRDDSPSWDHRAYWGANTLGPAWSLPADAVNNRNKGALPATGSWVKLSVTAAEVGLEGKNVTGVAFSLFGGRAAWDDAGVNAAAWVDDSVPGTTTADGGDSWNWVTPYGGGFAASSAYVSNYRKMPVRWAGGGRRDAWDLDYRDCAHGGPLPDWSAGWPACQPPLRRSMRGLGFGDCLRIQPWRWGRWNMYGTSEHDLLYAGDAAWQAAMALHNNNGGYVGRSACTDWPGVVYRDPTQYAVISFDERFDGSKVALFWKDRLVSYVELTDNAGNPQRISTTCTPDSVEPSKMRSWQARNPKDTRSNADGYITWDLLPMTLAGDVTAANAPTLDAVGYDPWWLTAYGAGNGWWAAGGPYNVDHAAQSMPSGYADLGGNLSVNNRNANMWNLNFPVTRSSYDGTQAGSREAREGAFESLIRTMCDHSNYYDAYHTYTRKENTMSNPTGIGRQVTPAEAADAAAATYAGRQFSAGPNWSEGSPTAMARPAANRYEWSAYSWNSWADIYDVTDLCQGLMWKILYDTSEATDIYDGNQNGMFDERVTTTAANPTVNPNVAYYWSNLGGCTTAGAVSGAFVGELRQINKLNLNEMWYPPTFAGVGWNESYTSFGRKPLKGFHSPSDAMNRHYFTNNWYPDPGYNLRVRPWDLDNDNSLDSAQLYPEGADYFPAHANRYDATHCANSPVYTIFVTGSAVDTEGEPLAEMRLRATVERTWDGRCNVLEFCWLPTDRSFME
jgi:hypothetical protein